MNLTTSCAPEVTPTLSVIVPMYNEREVLPVFLSRTVPTLDSLGVPYEILFVDDGSRMRG